MALVPKTDVDTHHRVDLEEITADLGRTLEFAATLGLHGVMILSRRCPGCGELHDFRMVTDLMEHIEQGDSELAGMLRFFAECAENGPDIRHSRKGAN